MHVLLLRRLVRLPCPSYCKQRCGEHWRACVFLNYGFPWVYIRPGVGLLGHVVALFRSLSLFLSIYLFGCAWS